MFSFKPPKPFSRREVAMLVVARKTEPPSTEIVMANTPDTSIPTLHAQFASSPAAPIRFKVSYSFGEYRNIGGGHARRAAFWLSLILVPAFLRDRHRAPVSEFTIDDEQIVRVAADGICAVRWSEVKSVRRRARGYIIDFADESMAIPHRCMDREHAERFRAFADFR